MKRLPLFRPFPLGCIAALVVICGVVVAEAQNAPPGPSLSTLNNAAAQRPPVVQPVVLPETNAYASSFYAVSAVPVSLFGFDLTEGATAGYFAFLDVATTPAAGAAITPKFCQYMAATSSLRNRQVIGDQYQNGLVIVSTSSCTTYTAVTPIQIGAQVK